jgi:thiamine-phosphate pyrophosphorylase
MLEDLQQLAVICDDWGSTLIVTDHYHLLDKADVQGIHIENMQADFKNIRKVITEEKTLGASANSIEDIRRIFSSGAVDYIGCGPFGRTETKPNDYPVLGIEGYKLLINSMEQEGINTPLLAVGGIRLEDTDDIIATGVYGIAVSGAVNMADDPAEMLRNFYRKLY